MDVAEAAANRCKPPAGFEVALGGDDEAVMKGLNLEASS